jgi:hypothetical protein
MSSWEKDVVNRIHLVERSFSQQNQSEDYELFFTGVRTFVKDVSQAFNSMGTPQIQNWLDRRTEKLDMREFDEDRVLFWQGYLSALDVFKNGEKYG